MSQVSPYGHIYANGMMWVSPAVQLARGHIVRAFPSAKLDNTTGLWTVSTSYEDLPYTLELAQLLQFTVDADLWSVYRPPALEAALERMEGQGLYPYQERGVRWLCGRTRALLGDEMGVGKTVQALMAIPEGSRTVVVAPPSAKHVWRMEALRWRPDIRSTVLDGRNVWKWPEPGEMVIGGYVTLPDWMQSPEDRPRAKPPRWKEMVSEGRECLGIFDEAHMCSNRKSRSTRRVKRLVEALDRVWALTGTPMIDKPQDLWTMLDTFGMGSTVFGGWPGYLRLMNGVKGHFGGYEYGDPEPEVPHRLRRVMLRRRKKDVLPELPPIRHSYVVVDAGGDVLAEMDGAWEEHRHTIEEGDLPPVTEMSTVRKAMALAKVAAMLELVEQYEAQGIPLVVFSAHIGPLEALEERPGWTTIHGGVDGQERKARENGFQEGRYIGLGVAIRAAGVALTLTRASDGIFVDMDWRAKLNRQAEDRLLRIGQEADAVLFKRLLLDHPLDRHSMDVITAKMAKADMAVDG